MIRFLMRTAIVCQAACIGAAHGFGRLGDLLYAIHAVSVGGADATTTTSDRPVTYATPTKPN